MQSSSHKHQWESSSSGELVMTDRNRKSLLAPEKKQKKSRKLSHNQDGVSGLSNHAAPAIGERRQSRPRTKGPLQSSIVFEFAPIPNHQGTDIALSFQDCQAAEAFGELRTPSVSTRTPDDVELVSGDQTRHIKAMMVAVLSRGWSDELLKPLPRWDQQSQVAQGYWNHWQAAEMGKIDAIMRPAQEGDDEDMYKLIERRLWLLPKEIIAIHRAGHVAGLTSEKDLICTNRISAVIRMIRCYSSVRLDIVDARKPLNVHFFAASPRTYAVRRIREMWKLYEQMELEQEEIQSADEQRLHPVEDDDNIIVAHQFAKNEEDQSSRAEKEMHGVDEQRSDSAENDDNIIVAHPSAKSETDRPRGSQEEKHALKEARLNTQLNAEKTKPGYQSGASDDDFEALQTRSVLQTTAEVASDRERAASGSSRRLHLSRRKRRGKPHPGLLARARLQFGHILQLAQTHAAKSRGRDRSVVRKET